MRSRFLCSDEEEKFDGYTDYTYDCENRLLSSTCDTLNPAHLGPDVVENGTFTGNANGWTLGSGGSGGWLYQLTNVDYNDGNETGYHYDTLGNRIDVNDGTSAAYIRNALNQYTSVGGTNYTYDKNGNLTNDGVRTYTYDCENRLIRAGGLLHNYKYDYRGRLVKGRYTINLRFTYDGDQVITEYIDSSGALLGKYIYGPGIDEPICRIHVYGGEETMFYYHFDGLGSVVALSEEDADIGEKYTYDVYGKPTITDAEGNERSSSLYYNRYMFTGRDYDTSTGLYYYRARFYNPDIGRFLQVDPFYYSAGLNLCKYVDNNPLNYTDPCGLMPQSIGIPTSITIFRKKLTCHERCDAWYRLGVAGCGAHFGLDCWTESPIAATIKWMLCMEKARAKHTKCVANCPPGP